MILQLGKIKQRREGSAKAVMLFLFSVFSVFFLPSCAWFEVQIQGSVTDINSGTCNTGNGFFIVSQIEKSENYQPITITPGDDGLNKTFTLNLKACLREFIKQDNSIPHTRFTVEYYRSIKNKIDGIKQVEKPLSDHNGCIRWQETYEYKYTLKPLWIGLVRTIIKDEGAHAGTERIPLAVNPWLSERDKVDHPPILDMRCEYSRNHDVFRENRDKYHSNGLKYLAETKSEERPLLWVPKVSLQAYEDTSSSFIEKVKNVDSNYQKDIRDFLKRYDPECGSNGVIKEDCYKRSLKIGFSVPLQLRTLDQSDATESELLGGTYDIETKLVIFPDGDKNVYLLHEEGSCLKEGHRLNRMNNNTLLFDCLFRLSRFTQSAKYKLVLRIKPSLENLPFKAFEGVYTISLNFQNKKETFEIDTNYGKEYKEVLETGKELTIIDDMSIIKSGDFEQASLTDGGKYRHHFYKGSIGGASSRFYSLLLDGYGDYKLSHIKGVVKDCSERENVVQRTAVFVGKICLTDVLTSRNIRNTPFRVLLEKEGIFEEKSEVFTTDTRQCIQVPIEIKHNIYDRQKYFKVNVHILSKNLYGKVRLALSPWQRAFQAFQNARHLKESTIRFNTDAGRIDKPKLIINQFRSINLFPSYGLDKLLNIHLFHRIYLLFQPFIRRPDNLALGTHFRSRELLRDGHYLVRVLILRNPQETGHTGHFARVGSTDKHDRERANKIMEDRINLEGARYITHTDSVVKAKANFINFYMPLYLSTRQFYYIASRNFIVIEIHPADPSRFVYKDDDEGRCEVDTEKTIWEPFFCDELINSPYVGAINLQNWVNWNLLQPAKQTDTDKIVEQSELGKKYKHFDFAKYKYKHLRKKDGGYVCDNEKRSDNKSSNLKPEYQTLNDEYKKKHSLIGGSTPFNGGCVEEVGSENDEEGMRDEAGMWAIKDMQKRIYNHNKSEREGKFLDLDEDGVKEVYRANWDEYFEDADPSFNIRKHLILGHPDPRLGDSVGTYKAVSEDKHKCLVGEPPLRMSPDVEGYISEAIDIPIKKTQIFNRNTLENRNDQYGNNYDLLNKSREEKSMNFDVLRSFSQENSLKIINLSKKEGDKFLEDIKSSFEKYIRMEEKKKEEDSSSANKFESNVDKWFANFVKKVISPDNKYMMKIEFLLESFPKGDSENLRSKLIHICRLTSSTKKEDPCVSDILKAYMKHTSIVLGKMEHNIPIENSGPYRIGKTEKSKPDRYTSIVLVNKEVPLSPLSIILNLKYNRNPVEEAFEESFKKCGTVISTLECYEEMKPYILESMDYLIQQMFIKRSSRRFLSEVVFGFFSLAKKKEFVKFVERECIHLPRRNYENCYYIILRRFYRETKESLKVLSGKEAWDAALVEKVEQAKKAKKFYELWVDSIKNQDEESERNEILSGKFAPNGKNIRTLINARIKPENKSENKPGNRELMPLVFSRSFCFFWFDFYLKDYLEKEQMISAYTNYIRKYDYKQILEYNSIEENGEGSFLQSFLRELNYENKELASCYKDYASCVTVEHCQERVTNTTTINYCPNIKSIEDKTCLNLLEEECSKDPKLSLCKNECIRNPHSPGCNGKQLCNVEVRGFCNTNKDQSLCEKYENRCFVNYLPCLREDKKFNIFHVDDVINYEEGFPPLKTCINNPYEFFKFDNKMVVHEISKNNPKYEGGLLENFSLSANYSIGSYMNWTAQRGRSMSASFKMGMGPRVPFLNLGISSDYGFSQSASSNESNSSQKSAGARINQALFYSVGRATITIGVTKFQKCLVVKPRPNAFTASLEKGEPIPYEDIWTKSAEYKDYKKIIISRPGLILCNPVETRDEKDAEQITESYYYISHTLNADNSQFLNLYDLANRPFLLVLRGRNEFVKHYHLMRMSMEGDDGNIQANGEVNKAPENQFINYPFPIEEAVGLSRNIREISETGFHPGVYHYPDNADEEIDVWFANKREKGQTLEFIDIIAHANIFEIPAVSGNTVPVRE